MGKSDETESRVPIESDRTIDEKIVGPPIWDWWYECYLDFVCIVVGSFVCEINGVIHIMRYLVCIMLL